MPGRSLQYRHQFLWSVRTLLRFTWNHMLWWRLRWPRDNDQLPRMRRRLHARRDLHGQWLCNDHNDGGADNHINDNIDNNVNNDIDDDINNDVDHVYAHDNDNHHGSALRRREHVRVWLLQGGRDLLPIGPQLSRPFLLRTVRRRAL